jgi:hypothetical protein
MNRKELRNFFLTTILVLGLGGLSSLFKYFGFPLAARIAFALGFLTALLFIGRGWILLILDLSRRFKSQRK